MSIPKGRPVLGKDLDAVRQQFGLTTGAALYLFGLSITRWMHVVRRDAELPLIDTSLALLVRFIDENPDIQMLPEFPSAADVFAEITASSDVHQKQFSIMLGAEASAAYRWLKTQSRQTPSVTRLLWHINTLLQSTPKRQRRKVIANWLKLVDAEGKARGVENILATGRWPVIDSKQRADSDDADEEP